MLERIAASAGDLPVVMTLDAGYWSEANAKHCEENGIDAYIATGRLPHGPGLIVQSLSPGLVPAGAAPSPAVL
jgi:hypothetical protein